jgi:dipeptidyl aminopeptidase/acylaminoacyl peptidase
MFDLQFRLTRITCLSFAASLSICAFSTSGHAQTFDTAAARSVDGHIAFIRRTPDRHVATSLGDQEATELWITTADRTKSRRLVSGRTSDSIERSLADLSSPRFSPDGRRVYFLSRAWVTSDAVHAVDVASGREWFIAPGNSLEVIPRGPFAGCLLVAQHRIREEGGSYDWTWLLTSRGKTIAVAATDSTDEPQRIATWMSGKVPVGALGAPRKKFSRANCS